MEVNKFVKLGIGRERLYLGLYLGVLQFGGLCGRLTMFILCLWQSDVAVTLFGSTDY